jgi:hypothetical protein
MNDGVTKTLLHPTCVVKWIAFFIEHERVPRVATEQKTYIRFSHIIAVGLRWIAQRPEFASRNEIRQCEGISA